MTYFDPGLPRFSSTRGHFRPVSALLGLIDTPFDARARRIRSRIAALRRLSDEDLARMGLARADIARHVLMNRDL